MTQTGPKSECQNGLYSLERACYAPSRAPDTGPPVYQLPPAHPQAPAIPPEAPASLTEASESVPEALETANRCA